MQRSRIEEDHPTAPINTYGWSKLFAEHMIQDHCRSYGLRAVTLRYFNAAGADESGEIGESHSPETHLIPSILRAALGLQPTVQLFGNDYDTRDGLGAEGAEPAADRCLGLEVASRAAVLSDCLLLSASEQAPSRCREKRSMQSPLPRAGEGGPSGPGEGLLLRLQFTTKAPLSPASQGLSPARGREDITACGRGTKLRTAAKLTPQIPQTKLKRCPPIRQRNSIHRAQLLIR